MARREFLRVGAMGLCGLSLADLLQAEALGGAAAPAKRPKSLIYVVLGGGPSHIDTWDPKPEAPVEYRGEFNTIPTKLPGVRLCELMPRQAEMMDRLALLRGVQSVENDHFLAEVYTGLPRAAGKRPAFGSVVSRLAQHDSPLPPYVCLNEASLMEQLMSPGCPSATVTNVNLTQTGSTVFTTTGYAVAVTRGYSYTYNVPASCLNGGTCADLAAEFAQSPTLQSSSCTGSTTCVCPLVYVPQDLTESGTYTTSGSTLTTTPTAGTAGTTSYCVEGNRLHFLDVQTITDMGAVTMRTRSDQVAQRQ